MGRIGRTAWIAVDYSGEYILPWKIIRLRIVVKSKRHARNLKT